MFIRYQHIEKWGHIETEGIQFGECYVFPKLDGTNAQVWFCDDEETIKAGSRNRTLSLEKDNAGFLAHVLENETLTRFMNAHKHIRLYGEWLVPHTIGGYREDAWRQFYIFDVYDHAVDRMLTYEEYASIPGIGCLNIIMPLAKIYNPEENNILHLVNNNTYLMMDGAGLGEGVVVKNYKFQNKFGRQVWAKYVRSEFKDDNRKAMGFSEMIGSVTNESYLADKYITHTFVDKERAKIELDMGIDRSVPLTKEQRKEFYPRLLQTVYYTVVKEEMLDMIKDLKGDKVINFKKLSQHVGAKTKEICSDLF